MPSITPLLLVLTMILSIEPLAASLKPCALKRGDTIAIVAPAKPGDPKVVEQVVQDLMRQGYRVKLAPNLLTRKGYLAGDDRERAEAFMECWRDPEVKALWCIAGGYGSARLLPLLDFRAIAARPKALIGMSDITALHMAIAKETGMVTFLGPTASHFFSIPGQEMAYARKWLWQTLAPPRPTNSYLVPYPLEGHAGRTLRSGKARGRITGGNLALLSSLVGTPWQPDTAGKILVLEEIGEPPYRIDRMLGQLKMAGLLENPAGVILASWHSCQSPSPDTSLSLDEVFAHYFGKAHYPVLKEFPSGHIPHQATLPLNCLAELDASNRTLTILESPVLTRPER